jgi:hypothetical protein
MQFFHRRKRTTRLITFVVIFLFIIQLVAPVANAQFIDPANLAVNQAQLFYDQWHNAQEQIKEVTKEAKDSLLERIFKSLVLSVSLTLRNTAVMATRSLAQGVTKKMASGDWGSMGDSSFYTDMWGKMLEDSRDRMVGKMLDEMRDYAWDELGLDICSPSLPELKLPIALGLDLQKDQKLAEPDCSLANLKGNYTALKNQIDNKIQQYKDLNGNPAGQAGLFLTEFFETQVGPGRGEISVGLELRSELRKNVTGATYAEEKQRTEFQGGKTALSLGSGKIKTPAFLTRGYIMSEQDAMVKDKPEVEAAGNVISDIPEAILGSFLTTFVSSAIKELTAKLLQKGLVNDAESYQPGVGQSLGYNKPGAAGSQIDVAFNRPEVNLTSINMSFDNRNLDLLSQFATCTDNRGYYNCVINHSFQSAVLSASQNEPMTLDDAIKQNLINGDLPLIHPDDPKNSEDSCYLDGYCYSNLVKLRMARIIPIGWEIAASQQKMLIETVTLKNVMAGFSSGEYEGLIDPDWVLKYPEARCVKEGYGPQHVADNVAERATYCADVQTCINSDENGTCEAWGYCASEKKVWNFGGVNCQPEFDSCKSLRSRTGKSADYLLKTVDNGSCDTTNAGCSWYSKFMGTLFSGFCSESVSTGCSAAIPCAEGNGECLYEWSWYDDVFAPEFSTHDNILNSKIILNKNIQSKTCSSQDEGCSEFIREKVDFGANMWPNGGFEEYGEPSVSDPFAVDLFEAKLPGERTDQNYFFSTQSINGNLSLNLNNNDVDVLSGPKIIIPPKLYKRYFVLSLYLNNQSGNVTDDFVISLNNSETDLNYSLFSTNDDEKFDDLVISFDEVTEGNWEKVNLMFEFSSIFDNLENVDYGFAFDFTVNNGSWLVDDVALFELSIPSWGLYERIVDNSGYNVDYGESNEDTAVYLKKAPEYLGCYDTTNSDFYGRPVENSYVNFANDAKSIDRGPMPRACDNFAELCSAEDVGCDSFRPVDVELGVVTGNTVYGVPSFEDYCPASCDGYQAFKQDLTNFETSAFPLYLIPKEGETCDAVEVGCDEFTNLDTLAAGGEAREYYSRLKQCVKIPENDSQCTTFYTWTAQGTEGYQLQEHYLEKIGNAPKFNTDPVSDDVCDEDSFNDNLSPDSNPDCTQFYDEAGTVYYGFASETVTCSEDCHPYRRTIQYEDVVACNLQGGEWSSDDKECVFMAIPNQGQTCQVENAGCRRYEGNFVGDEQIVIQTGFEDWSEKGDMFESDNPPNNVIEGPIMIVEGAPGANFITDSEKINLAEFGEGDYMVSFWAKEENSTGSGDVRVVYDFATVVNSTWQAFSDDWSFNNFKFTVDSSFDSHETIGVQVSADGVMYMDNFKITKISDIDYLIKDSWDTPVSCDNAITYEPTDEFDRQMPYAMVGCRAYQDTEGSTHYLRSFSGLCLSGQVGCEALIDTKNSFNYAGKDIDIGGTTVSLTQDSVMYLINNEEDRCSSNSKGCSALGLPEISVSTVYDDTSQTYISTESIKRVDGKQVFGAYYYILDPESFEDTQDNVLCSDSSVGCEEYRDENSNAYYFRDPGDMVCEYREGYLVNEDRTVTGWFKKKVEGDEYIGDAPCSISDYYNDGSAQLIRNYDDNYNSTLNWAGVCHRDADSCTAFVDPTDRKVTGNEAKKEVGHAYYFLNDESIDRSCTSVSRENGCILFSNTSEMTPGGNIANTVNSFMTYANSNNGPSTSGSLSTFANIDWEVVGCDDDTFTKWQNAENDPYEPNLYCTEMQKCLNIANVIDDPAQLIDVCIAELKAYDRFDDTLSTKEYVCTVQDYTGQAGENELTTNAACTARLLTQNDSNSIIKVVQDRECDSWYDCKIFHYAWDNEKSDYVKICDRLGLCTQLGEGDNNSNDQCVDFVQEPYDRNLVSQNERLTKASYQQRSKGWFDLDYAGYAIYNMMPLQFLTAVDLTPDADENQYRLVEYSETATCSIGSGGYTNNCNDDLEDDDFCNLNNPDYCACLDSKCYRAIGTSFGRVEESIKDEPMCRIYPNSDSPYPKAYRQIIEEKETGDSYQLADSLNYSFIASDDIGSIDPSRDYGCFYKEVSFGSLESKFYPNYQKDYSPKIPGTESGYCQDEVSFACDCDSGGELYYQERAEEVEYDVGGTRTVLRPSEERYINNQMMCSSNSCAGANTESNNVGLCLKRDNKIKTYSGVSGYCLQADTSFDLPYDSTMSPCLLWYPLDNMVGIDDTRLNDPNAGFDDWATYYFGKNENPNFCLEMETWEKRTGYIGKSSGEVYSGKAPQSIENYLMPTYCDVGSNETNCNTNPNDLFWTTDAYSNRDSGINIYCPSWVSELPEDAQDLYCTYNSSGILTYGLTPNVANMLNMKKTSDSSHKDLDLSNYNVDNLGRSRIGVGDVEKRRDYLLPISASNNDWSTANYSPTSNWWWDYAFQEWYEHNYRKLNPNFDFDTYSAVSLFEKMDGPISTLYEVLSYKYLMYLGSIESECGISYGSYENVYECEPGVSVYSYSFLRAMLRTVERMNQPGDPAFVSSCNALGLSGCSYFKGPKCETGYIPGRISFVDVWKSSEVYSLITHYECVPDKLYGYERSDYSNAGGGEWFVSTDITTGTSSVIDGKTNLLRWSELFSDDDLNEGFGQVSRFQGTYKRGIEGKHWYEPYYYESVGVSKDSNDQLYYDPRPFEVSSPVCSKVIEIPTESQVWSDNFYQYVKLGKSTQCGNDTEATIPNLAGNTVEYNHEGYLSEVNSNCKFFGALPTTSDDISTTTDSIDEARMIFLYNKPIKSEEYSTSKDYTPSIVNADNWRCFSGADNVMPEGGTMCFDDQRETGANYDEWQLRQLFLEAGQMWEHQGLSLPQSRLYVDQSVTDKFNSTADASGEYWQYLQSTSDPAWNDEQKGVRDVGIGSVDIKNKVFAPIVSAYLVSGRTNSNGQKTNEAYPHKLNFNGSIDGNVNYLDRESLVGNLKFYFWSDHNAMPNRQLKIDWGDSGQEIVIGEAREDNESSSSSIKNYKPFCSSQVGDVLGECGKRLSQTPGGSVPDTCTDPTDCSYQGTAECVEGYCVDIVKGYSCREDVDCSHLTGYECLPKSDRQDRFGSSSLACEQGYFHITNVYDCQAPRDTMTNEKCVDTYDTNCYETTGVCTDNVTFCDTDSDCPSLHSCIERDYCQFRPKVQVMDNWNWCNENVGDVTQMYQNASNESDKFGFLRKGGGLSQTVNPSSPADIDFYSGYYDDACTRSGSATARNAWTWYNGYIRIFPSIGISAVSELEF